MKKIGFILNKLNNGGAQRATANLANALCENGFSVIVYLVKDEEITFKLRENIKTVVIGRPLNTKNGCDYFTKEKDKEGIDIYITPMHFDLSYLRIINAIAKKGIKTIVIEHASYFYPLSLKLDNPAIHYKEKLDIYKNVSALWCVNAREASIWKELGIRTVKYIPNIFEPSGEEKNRESSTNISYVGRLQADKNVIELVEWIDPILKSNPEWKLLIAGQGNQEKLLKLKIKQQKLENQVEFLGFVKNVEELYRKTEILVIPSNNETFSYALAEAKAFGIPAIIRQNEFNALIKDTEGHITFTDEVDFQSNLIELIQKKELRKELSLVSKRSIRDAFTWNKIGHIYKNALEEATRGEIVDEKDDKIDYHLLFQSVIQECEYSLKSFQPNEKIKIIKETQKLELTRYALDFDKNFPLKSKRRSIAVKLLWFIHKLSKLWENSTKVQRKGFFCVDWETMPEIKNTILNKLKDPVYYFQTGKGKVINEKVLRQLDRAEYIVMSSETRWLKQKKPDQKRVFINHACGAFKKTGFAISKNYKNLYGDYDVVISSSPYISKELSEAFQTPENKIMATGLPRTDKCFDRSYLSTIREQIYKKYDSLKKKKIYLFAPTFRTENGIYFNKFKLNWTDVSKELKDDEIIIISLHPHIKNQASVIPLSAITNIPPDLSNIKFINEFSTFELCTVSNLFITDYSSAIFEAMLLNNDVAFFAEDIEEYNRGFYFDYYTEGPCSPCSSSNAKEFIKYLRDQKNNHKSERYIAFKEKHLASCDGHSTERVLALLNGVK